MTGLVLLFVGIPGSGGVGATAEWSLGDFENMRSIQCGSRSTC